ncbi:hypothetical protein F6P94_11175 [Escherichia coli]|nr:hypothetical protein F6P94_11175 [Escherichia coli]
MENNMNFLMRAIFSLLLLLLLFCSLLDQVVMAYGRFKHDAAFLICFTCFASAQTGGVIDKRSLELIISLFNIRQ